jgi:hypothetical protein
MSGPYVPIYVGGITNAQAKYLGKLCRAAGEPYCGSGLSKWDASQEIGRLRVVLAKRHLAAEEAAKVEAQGRSAAPPAGRTGGRTGGGSAGPEDRHPARPAARLARPPDGAEPPRPR